jgi:hypothetical protein
MPQKEEDDYWIPIPRSVTAWASRFGVLEGITGVRPARRVELMPYVSTGASFSQGVDPRDPFRESRETSLRTRADLRGVFGRAGHDLP